MNKWLTNEQWSSMRRAHTAASGTTFSVDASFVLLPVQLVILGHLPSMKNSRALAKNRRTGRMFSRKSDEAISFVNAFIALCPPETRKMALGSSRRPLRAIVSVWYRSERSDLDCALVYDCLQQAGVVANDRFIVEKHEYRHVDRKNPRVELTIEEI